MQWTVDAVSRKTSGYGDSLKTVGFLIVATRHTEMGEHRLDIVVPLHMGHPLVGDLITTDIEWSSLDELETARIAEALQP